MAMDSDIIIDDYYDQGFDESLMSDDQQYLDMDAPAVSLVWETCMYPSIVQVSQHMFTYVIWNLVFRFTSQTIGLSRNLQHFSSIACGLALQWSILGHSSFYGLVLIGMTYLLFYTVTTMNLKSYGISLALFSLSLLCIGELVASDAQTWHKMRGTQMVAAMKIISLCFDIDRSRVLQIPNGLEFCGYILCPANAIMGPWCSYDEYTLIYHKPRWTLKWVCQVVMNCVLSILFLLASNCLITSFIPDFGFTWLLVYKGAFSYRCSHYFVCFFSQGTMLLAGLTQSRPTKKDKSILGYPISKPWIIEMPRSLVNVVVYWNLSMHYWLKTYVFQQMKPYGKFTAILSTYLISSLLHGINFQLASVLLTLGFATYAEFTLRAKIAEIFDACITAHSCGESCQHLHKANNPYVIAINIGFGLLTIVNLAYLGIMFEGPIENQETGSSLQHVLKKWGELNFLTHWIIGFIFILNSFI